MWKWCKNIRTICNNSWMNIILRFIKNTGCLFCWSSHRRTRSTSRRLKLNRISTSYLNRSRRKSRKSRLHTLRHLIYIFHNTKSAHTIWMTLLLNTIKKNINLSFYSILTIWKTKWIGWMVLNRHSTCGIWGTNWTVMMIWKSNTNSWKKS